MEINIPSMKKTYYFILLVVLVAGAFFGGYQYGKSKNASANFGNRGNFQFANRNLTRQGQGGNRNMARDGSARGQIITKDTNSITLKLDDGGSKIIFFSTSTPVRKMIEVTLNDIKTGENIAVNGDQNADGSITARSLQLVTSSTIGF